MSMKEPSLSRWRRPNSSKKLKLVCSFNGQFHTRPYSGKLTYVGGDTRIISVDRGIGFLKLRSKISELCPNTRSFFLKYRLPESDPLHADTTNLVLITSDDDVRCMVDEYDKIDCYGQQSRLRLFVCSDNGYVNVNLPVNWTDNRIDCVRGKRGIDFLRNETRGEFGDYPSNVSRTRSESHLFGLQFDAIEINNQETAVAGDWRSDHSLIKPVVKKQLPVTKPAPVSSIWSGEREFGGSYDQKYCQPLIDLAPEALVPNIIQTANMNIEHPHEAKYLNCRTEDALFPGNRDFEILVRNGNTEAYGTGLSGRNAGAMNQDISNTSNGVVQFPQLPFNSSVVSASSDSNAKQALRKIDTLSWTNFNRENLPCPANYNPGKTGLMPFSCSDEMVGSAYPMEILSTSDRPGDLQSGIRRHKFGVWDTRNHRVCLYHTRNHQNNLSDMGSNRNLRLDGRPSSGRCCPGLRPNSNITKQGQSMRSYHPNYLKPWFCTHTHALQGLMRMMDSSFNSLSSSHGLLHANKNKIDQGIIGSEYGNLNFRQSTFAYHGPYSGMGNLPLFSGNAVENPLKDGFLIDYGNGMHEVPQQNPYKNFHGVLTNCESGCHDPKHPFSWLPQKVENISAFPNYPGYGKGTKLKGNSNLSDREACFVSLITNCDGAACTLQGGVASPVETRHDSASLTLPGRVASPADLSLCNLSLSSSKEVGPLVLSSPVYPDVSETVLKSKSKHLDLIDGYSGPEGYKSNGMESGSLTGAAANFGNDYVHKEEIEQDPSSALNLDEKVCTKESHKSSKVKGGASSDMAAFYSLLATRELQTIKNSDLEYIKELGSGTYGTVSYGKWKGSDVAIKRIKPSCFTQNTLKKDRLVVDFWKEAHMLGQLHHPNIVAFYGVVTDGPMKNLATVTEYMVNGSLKQVLQKRDRTIDHRKRLIIARDAAFGMEYLHGKNIVHFDLKSHNFLMNMRDPQRPVCKIGDLGLSKIKQRTLISGGLRGTIPWMAPELFNSKNDLVTEKVDVYSFGIVMWELLTGEEPYGKLCSEEIIGGIIKGNLRPEIPTCDPAWRSLMERCWSSDPGSRPDFSEIAKELRVMSAAMNIK